MVSAVVVIIAAVWQATGWAASCGDFGASQFDGYNCVFSLSSDDSVKLHYSISQEDQIISLAAVFSPKQSTISRSSDATVAFGVSSDDMMTNSEVVIGGFSAVDGEFADRYSIVARAPSGIITQDDPLELAQNVQGGIDESNNQVTVSFEYPLSGPTFGNNLSQSVNIIWADHPGGDLRKDKHTSSSRRGIAQVNFVEGSASGNVAGASKAKYKAHGAIMFTAWAVLVPVAVFFARFGKRSKSWFSIHIVANSLAVCLVIAGTAIALAKFSREANYAHAQLGIVILAASIAHLLAGIGKPLWESNQRGRVAWGFIHRLVGRILLLLSVWQIHTGLEQYQSLFGSTRTVTLLYWLYVALLAVLGLSVEEQFLLSSRQSSRTSPMTESSQKHDAFSRSSDV